MAIATPTDTVDRTPAAVFATAEGFRTDIGRLLEPGGMTRRNVSAVASWMDGRVWDLLDANDVVLEQWARGAIR